MVRSAVADDSLLPYFHNIAKQNTYTIGLILGQSLSNKDFIIHVAKTPFYQLQDLKEAVKPPLNISDIDDDLVVDHARQATRMMPGGMFVLGLFFVSAEDSLNPFSPKIKSILARMHKFLETQQYLFGTADSNEKLVLNYCSKTQQFTCKSYDVITGSVKPAEIKFLSNAIKWIQVKCTYLMDQVYPIAETDTDYSLKKHIGCILDTLNRNLTSSLYLFDGEFREEDETIDSVGKRKVARNVKVNFQEDHKKPIQVSVLQPYTTEDSSSFEISEVSNQIRIFGRVVSKLWLNPKMLIRQASTALRHDIMRSLSTRFEMHWDSLTEEEHGEDINSVHEPPRRVLVALPNTNIAISDYLFPGEGPHDAKISLEEMLDIKLDDEVHVQDVEGQADLTEFYSETSSPINDETLTKNGNSESKTLYLIGLGLALLVLIISLVIHFIKDE